MEFVDLGKHCSLEHCRMQDFLPFTCTACNQVFCKDHWKYDCHNCRHKPVGNTVFRCPICQTGVSILAGQDPNITFDRHVSSGQCGSAPKKLQCPVPRCKKKLTNVNSMTCNGCKGRFCITHRFKDSHNCPAQGNEGPSKKKCEIM